MENFMASSFGQFLLSLFSSLFTHPSTQSFWVLAYGWSVATEHHTIARYLWLSGAVSEKHFSRYYLFLSGPFRSALEQLWSVVIVQAASLVNEKQPIRLKGDDFVKKKSGKPIQGAGNYRNGAGRARQEYRVLFGLNCVYAIMLVPMPFCPERSLAVPIGLKVDLKEALADKLGIPYRSRSELARESIDLAARLLPSRRIIVTGDGGYATKDFLRDRPKSVSVVSRLPINSKLYAWPVLPSKGRRGRKPKTGKLLGSPQTLALECSDFLPHPTEKGASIKEIVGIWHTVLPGQLIRVVIVERDTSQSPKKRPLEAFFSTDTSLSVAEVLLEYRDRWSIELSIRDANGYYGIGMDRCRNYQRLLSVNNLRFLMAATRTLWFIDKMTRNERPNWRRFRPWYRHKEKPSQRDVIMAYREALAYEGISPTIRFLQDMPEIHHQQDKTLHKAA